MPQLLAKIVLLEADLLHHLTLVKVFDWFQTIDGEYPTDYCLNAEHLGDQAVAVHYGELIARYEGIIGEDAASLVE